MQPLTIEILKKLTKGRSALTGEQLVALRRDLAEATDAQVLDAIAMSVKAPKAPAKKPAWLSEIESAKKRVTWSKDGATVKLIQVAEDEGLLAGQKFQSKKGNLQGFAAVAKKIAGSEHGPRLAEVFVKEVTRIEREYALG